VAELRRPAGITALVIFFIFGTTMAGLSCIALAVPGSFLEPMWRLNPSARDGLVQLGAWAPILMAIVSAACGIAAIGLWRGRSWGWRMALTVLAVNFVGDAGNVAIRGDWRTIIGLPVGGAMIAYLLSRNARRWFGRA
jgi:hypothetical protein